MVSEEVGKFSEEVGKWLILGKVYIPRNPVATGGSEDWQGKISMLPRHQSPHLTTAVRNLEKKNERGEARGYQDQGEAL